MIIIFFGDLSKLDNLQNFEYESPHLLSIIHNARNYYRPKMSKYYSYNFYLIPAKLHRDIAYHGGIQAKTFLGYQPSFKTFCSTLKF